MRKIIFIFYYFACFFYSLEGYSQKTKSFEIVEVRTDKTYFNLLQFDNQLFIGSSAGAIRIDGKKNIENIDPSLKGYLTVENNQLKGNSSFFGHIIKADENIYNYLLPSAYQNLISRHNIYDGHLYIINNGKLFIFKENDYTISHDSLSVRSITQNYIGSYKGIFKNGVKLKFPEYTDGYIREFDKETFICYEGLYRDSNGISTSYTNSKKEVVVAGKILGFARDIQKIENGAYVLVTNKGIYLINFSKNSVETINEDTKNLENFSVFKIERGSINLTRIFYTASDKIYYYAIQTKENTIGLDTKYGKTIRQAFFPNTIDKIYVLYDDKLSLFSLNQQTNKYTEDILINNLVFAHNFVFYKEKIMVSTNIGLHLFDIKKNKPYLNIIPLETNNRSLTVINDTVKFGTINGIVNLTDEQIGNIVKDLDNNISNSKKDSDNANINYIILISIIGILLIAILLLFKRLKKARLASNSNKTVDDNFYGEANKENIIHYIQENITTVTIQSIRDQFNLTPIMLYEVLGNDKPGELIRNHRMELVRKYRRMKVSEEEISQKTGFSVSYLKKIY